MSILQLYAQNNEWGHDTITFEEPYEYLILDTSSQNIWQIGRPQKTFFDSAYSPPNAIVTDTINFYPVNCNSHFDLKIGQFNFDEDYPCDMFLEMKHKFDTDTLKDGGYISVSYDNGQTWMNFIEDTVYYHVCAGGIDYYNLYSDTLYNGEYGFSGHSNGWITTYFSWHYYPVKSVDSIPDTMIIRFNFISDSIQNNKEGWMIDNIKLYSVELDGAIKDTKSLNFNIVPNPMNDISVVEMENYSEAELSIYNIEGKLIKQKKYTDNQTITINKENLNPGIYFVKIKADDNATGIKKLIVN